MPERCSSYMGRTRNICSVRTIAEKAGVSAMIVSAVLKGKESKSHNVRYSVDTADRVKRIANEMGYVPNRLTNVLIGKEIFALGVISPYGGHERYDAVIRNFAVRCQAKGWHLIFVPCGISHAEHMEKLRSLLSLQVDRIVMIPTTSEHIDSASVLAECREKFALCPDLMCVDWFRDELVFDCVEPDERLMIELPLRHLKAMGHRLVGMIGSSSPRRERILVETLRKLGMEETLDMALAGYLPVNFSVDIVADLVRGILRRSPRPTALYCWHDSIATEAYRVCECEFGLKIGRDIAIIGQDDTLQACGMPVPLTSLNLCNDSVAEGLFKIVEDRISGKAAGGPLRSLVKPMLKVRESSNFKI